MTESAAITPLADLAAGTYVLDASHSEVGFVARHAMVTKVRGYFRELEGTITVADDFAASTATATMQVASIDSGSADRDGHLKSADFFDVENYPVITFASTGIKDVKGEEFTLDEKLADFSYYDPITTGDSSLSAVVQSIIAAEVGLPETALAYFDAALYTDLGDLHHNTSDGAHIASTGGVWNALVQGFGGMRGHDGAISFDPRLPREWTSMTYPLRVRGTRVRVHLTGGLSVDVMSDDLPGSLVFGLVLAGVPAALGAAVGAALRSSGGRRARH